MPQPRENPFFKPLAEFQAPQLGGARAAAKGLIAGAGGRRFEQGNVAAVMQMFGGPRGGLTARELEMSIRRTQFAAQAGGIKVNELIQMGQMGQQIGARFGVDPRVGMASAQQAAIFGKQFQQQVGPSGGRGLSAVEARALDQELRMQAAQSPMANMMGAVMAMAEAGVLTKDINGVNPNDLKSADPKVKRAAMERLSQMNPAQVVDAAQQAGVDPSVAAEFLGSREANREQVARHNIQDVVRERQGDEIAAIMSQQMAGAFMPALKQMGMDPRSRRMMANTAGAAIQEALENMAESPEDRALLTDPTKAAERNKKLAEAVQAAGVEIEGGQERLQQLVASSVRSMEERVRSDPNLAKFKDLAGLIDINRQDILGTGEKGGGARAAAVGVETKAAEKLGQKDPGVVKMEAMQAKREEARKQQQMAAQQKQEDDAKRVERIAELQKKFGIDPETAGGQAAMLGLRARANLPMGLGGLNEEQRELTRLTQEQQQLEKKEAEAKKGPGGGAAPGQGPIRITGTLTVKADGSAQLEAEGGLPVNN